MKNNKQKKLGKVQHQDEVEYFKPKKKAPAVDTKVNIKSKKFWEEIYDTEGDEIEKFIR